MFMICSGDCIKYSNFCSKLGKNLFQPLETYMVTILNSCVLSCIVVREGVGAQLQMSKRLCMNINEIKNRQIQWTEEVDLMYEIGNFQSIFRGAPKHILFTNRKEWDLTLAFANLRLPIWTSGKEIKSFHTIKRNCNTNIIIWRSFKGGTRTYMLLNLWKFCSSFLS